MIHTTPTAPAGTGTAGTGTGTVTTSSTGSSSMTTPTDLLPHGAAVTIDAWTRAADGSTIQFQELVGTIAGSRNHPHSGVTIYLVSTSAGTEVEVYADRVHLAAVPADWALELDTPAGWVPVPAGAGDRFNGSTMIVPTLDMLHAFALIAAGRARIPGSRVRASIAVASGLACWHVEQPLDAEVAYGVLVTLEGGRELALSFGTLRAREAAVGVLEVLPWVASAQGFGNSV